MKTEFPHDLFHSVLCEQHQDYAVAFEHALRQQTDAAIVATGSLDLSSYVELGCCEVELRSSVSPIQLRYWGGIRSDRIYNSVEQSVSDVKWGQHPLVIVRASWPRNYTRSERFWVLAETEEIAKQFILDLSRKTNDPRESILVFSGGCWRNDGELYDSVADSSFDDLILPLDLKSSIRADFRQFLAAETKYQSLGLPWRRGALFLGPPGNGKTHCIRALLNELKIPSLYVKSLASRFDTPQAMLQLVFDRARMLPTAVLVFEDLDTLINQENLSFFLNELDGFHRNNGLIVLATSNHPERIDPAIIERPSRFDRKYHFDLPEIELRKKFLNMWRAKVAAQTEWQDDDVDRCATETEGFSFAYLQELMLSGLLAWVSDEGKPFANHLEIQLQLLLAQLSSGKDSSVAELNQDNDGHGENGRP